MRSEAYRSHRSSQTLLAYCRRLGLHVPAVRGVGEFPEPDRGRVFAEVDQALVAVGCSRWG